ncbi:hypothetical protein WH47_10164 [Habropoda laboriosa]|uniref:Uncharacterized protein n=1 Tax=Habropoda laboriosa TaxID=597456 RepID=A0A0L7R498_9HYME|nr:hypothetical protein WH47_10164 [Habropoda laboriosa]
MAATPVKVLKIIVDKKQALPFLEPSSIFLATNQSLRGLIPEREEIEKRRGKASMLPPISIPVKPRRQSDKAIQTRSPRMVYQRRFKTLLDCYNPHRKIERCLSELQTKKNRELFKILGLLNHGRFLALFTGVSSPVVRANPREIAPNKNGIVRARKRHGWRGLAADPTSLQLTYRQIEFHLEQAASRRPEQNLSHLKFIPKLGNSSKTLRESIETIRLEKIPNFVLVELPYPTLELFSQLKLPVTPPVNKQYWQTPQKRKEIFTNKEKAHSERVKMTETRLIKARWVKEPVEPIYKDLQEENEACLWKEYSKSTGSKMCFGSRARVPGGQFER